MDGVLVDNLSFDGAVTDFIVSALAEQRSITRVGAKRAWERELAESRTDCRWYDYDFHCQRLGLSNLASEAHAALTDRLRPVPGARVTVDLLRRSDTEVVVATDAVRAVAEFKLGHLGLNADRIIYRSEGTCAVTTFPAAPGRDHRTLAAATQLDHLGLVLVGKRPSRSSLLFHDRHDEHPFPACSADLRCPSKRGNATQAWIFMYIGTIAKSSSGSYSQEGAPVEEIASSSTPLAVSGLCRTPCFRTRLSYNQRGRPTG
jgi:phosphoglycolate phosphatase-like HAD superfamily hydrolase